MDDQNDWQHLSISDKLSHKNWKARSDGYMQLQKNIMILDESKGFQEFQDVFTRLPFDTNLAVQEKGLEVVLKIITINSSTAKSICRDISTGIVTKCLSSKPKIKQFSIQILLQFIECADQAQVILALQTGLTAKQPKIVAASIDVFVVALHEFGPKAIPVKDFVNESIKLLEHGDKSVRDSVKSLIVEIYRWMKDGVKMFIKDIKQLQLNELEDEFKKIQTEKPTPSRYIGGEKLKQTTTQTHQQDIETVESDQQIDAFDLIDPVDIVAKISPQFYTDICETKWQIRKEAIDKIEQILDVAKIKNNDFNELISCLKNIISSDTNINVASIAVKCVGNLAKGLRSNFASNAQSFLPLVIDKFKEKRGSIVENSRNTIDALFTCLNFDIVFSIISEYFKHKSPSIKEETLRYLIRLIQLTGKGNLQKSHAKIICMSLLKVIQDSVQNVRDLAFEALAHLMILFGESSITMYLEGIDETKIIKLKESFSKLNSTTIVTLVDKPVTRSHSQTITKTKSIEEVASKDSKTVAIQSKPVSSKSVKLTANKPPMSKSVNVNDYSADQNDPPDVSVGESEAIELATQLLGNESAEMLSSSAWKDRLNAFELLVEKVKNSTSDPATVFAILNLKPGWKDTNFQVVKTKFSIISVLVKKTSNLPLPIVHQATLVMADKISDVKLKEQVCITLLDLCDTSSPNYVSLRIAFALQNTKNIKNQIESFVFFNQCILEYGMKLDVKHYVTLAKKTLDSPNPDLKKTVISFIVTIYKFLGGKLRILLDDLKPSMLQVIESEFEKVKDEKPPQPTRVKTEALDQMEVEGDENDAEGEEVKEEEKKVEEIDMEELITRVDISNEFTEELFQQLNEKNWKLRNEALDKISKIIKFAKFITPDIGDLPNSIANRLSDSNKNLVIITLSICNDLVNAMGKQINQHRFVLIPAIISTLSDGKVQIRTAATSLLTAWVSKCGLTTLVEGEESLLTQAYKNNSATLKCEINNWLNQMLSSNKISASLLHCLVLPVVNCATDRNADTRKSSQTLIITIANIVGIDMIQKTVNTLDSVTQVALKTTMETIASQVAINKANSKPNSNSTKGNSGGCGKIQTEKEGESKNIQKSGSESKNINRLPSNELSCVVAPEAIKIEEIPPIIFKANSKLMRMKENFYRFQNNVKDFIPTLSSQMQLYLLPSIHADLFNNDFKKQNNGIQSIINLFQEPIVYVSSILECSDLLICYIGIRIFDGNPTVLSKCNELLDKVFNFLLQNNQRLSNEEADAILPHLVNRLGDSKESIRKQVQSLIKMITLMYSIPTILNHIINGCDAKASKVRSESLTLFNTIISDESIVILNLPSGQKLCQDVAKMLSDKDSSVRMASLTFFTNLYSQIGEKVYSYTGTLNSKESTLLKERIKRLPKPDLGKTFCISNVESNSSLNDSTTFQDATQISSSNTTLNKTINLCDSSIVESKLFDMDSFLAGYGIRISNKTIEPVKVPVEFDEKYIYKPPHMENIQMLHVMDIPLFMSLPSKLESNCMTSQDLCEIVSHLPVLYNSPTISDSTNANMSLCIKLLISNLMKHLSLQQNQIDVLKNSFQIITFVCYTSSYLHCTPQKILVETFQLLTDLFDYFDGQIDSNIALIVKAFTKSVLCLLSQLLPLHVIAEILLILSFNPKINGNNSKCEILKHCINMATCRLSHPPSPPFIHVDSFAEIYDNPEYLQIYCITCDEKDHYRELKHMFDKMLSCFVDYVGNNEKRQLKDEILSKYPLLNERTNNLTFPKLNLSFSTLDIIITEICENIKNVENRINMSNQLFHLSLEHNIKFNQHQSFKQLSGGVRLFVQINSHLVPTNRINAVLSLIEPPANGCNYKSIDYYNNRLNEINDKLTNICHRFSHYLNTPSDNSFEMASKIDPLVKENIEKNPSNLVPPTCLSQETAQVFDSVETSKKSETNMEDLRRRFQNIKNKFGT